MKYHIRLKRIFALIVVLILLLLSTYTSLGQITSVDSNFKIQSPYGDILFVGGFGPNNYSKIQEAINAANDSDVIFVYNGEYFENIVINKSLFLIGENRYLTFINGSGKGDVIKIEAKKALLYNFTVCNDGENLTDAGIEIVSDNNIILNNICRNVNYGIWIRDYTNNIIIENTCYAKWDGIWLINSGNNYLRRNKMYGSGLVLDGSCLNDFLHYMDWTNLVNDEKVYYLKNKKNFSLKKEAGQVILVNCTNCTIKDQNIANVTDGIGIFYSDCNYIINNTITKTTDFGIRLVKSNCNAIKNNILSDNPIGIGFMSGGVWEYNLPVECHRNKIKQNKFANNYWGIRFDSSDMNLIMKNIFVKNIIDADFQDSNNIWFNNYWSRPRFLPMPIFGKKTFFNWQRTCIEFDWRPMIKP